MQKQPSPAVFTAFRPPPPLNGDLARAAFVADLTALAFGLHPHRLARPSRDDRDAVLSRRVAYYLAHIAAGLNLARVSAAFGCDRSTVSKACLAVEELRDDPGFDRALTQLETCIRAAPAETVALPRASA